MVFVNETKQMKRAEKRRKKLVALSNIIKMNDRDREKRFNCTSYSEDNNFEEAKEDNKRFDDQLKKEPLTKKVKLENGKLQTEIVEADLNEMKFNLSDDQYIQLKRELRERKHKLSNVPKFHLREVGYRASLNIPQNSRTPIFVTDIQHLLMLAFLGKKSPCNPERWCYLENQHQLSHTIVLILNGFSLYHYLSNETWFKKTNKIFEVKLEVVLPSKHEHSILRDLATVPLTNIQAEDLIKKYGSLETAIELNKDSTLLINTIFPVEKREINSFTDFDLYPGEKFPRTKLLLSALQMVDEGYPMPLQGDLQDRFKNYVFTKEKYAPVNNKSPMFGVDCEMCRTSTGYNELTRISIVNEKLETVYETLVMPTNKIIDYLTKYSGITKEMMNTVTKNLSEVQTDVRNLLPPDAILIGQSLNSDLNAMQMMHPYIIDTSIIFNLTGVRRRKSKLQTLAKTFLEENIQVNTDGHDPVEDSLASMKLVKMKLANNLEYGDIILTEKKHLNETISASTSERIQNNIFSHAVQKDKRTSIVTTENPKEETKQEIKKTTEERMKKKSFQNLLETLNYFEFETNNDVIKKTKEIAIDNFLTIVNLNVIPESLKLDRIENTVTKIDKWIGKLWKTTAHNGMFLVLMGGSNDCLKGLFTISIKKINA